MGLAHLALHTTPKSLPKIDPCGSSERCYTRNRCKVIQSGTVMHGMQHQKRCTMKAYELPTKVIPGGTIQLPNTLAELLPDNQVVRVIILVSEPEDMEEETAWSRLTAEQFLAGYSAGDTIYDRV